jgi:hypothetical protein
LKIKDVDALKYFVWMGPFRRNMPLILNFDKDTAIEKKKKLKI